MKLNGAIRWWRSILEAQVQKLISRLQATIKGNRDNLSIMIMDSRPEGRDSAEKCRSCGTANNDASSAAIEVLQSMNARGQIKDDKEDSQMAQILQRKDAKIELQQNMIALQREEMQKR
jgi:hypothetical protein